MINRLPAKDRVTAKAAIIADKTVKAQAREERRRVWKAHVNENGNIVAYGVGNNRPMGFRPDSLLVLLDHSEELRGLCQKALAIKASIKASEPQDVDTTNESEE